MSSKFIKDNENKKWMQKRNKSIRKNQVLMSKLKDMCVGFDQSTIFNEQNLIECKKVISEMLIKWVNIQTDQQLQVLNSSHISNHINKNQQQQPSSQPSSSILQYDYSLKCQISGLIPSKPSRTSQCKFLCVVDGHILQQNKICSCGRQVQKYQNQIVGDWILQIVIKYFKLIKYDSNNSEDRSKKQNKKWKGLIRINLQQKDFEFVYQ